MAPADSPPRSLIWLALGAVACACACATAQGEEAASNADTKGDASSTDVSPDGASELDGSNGQDGQDGQDGQASPDAEPCAAELKINELQTVGPNGERDEFVELFNDGTCTLLLDGYTLSYRSNEGEEQLVWSAAAGQTMQPGQFFVVGGTAFTGTSDFPMNGAVALDALGGGLRLAKGGVGLDSVGWGLATGGFVEGSAALAPPSGASVGRRPDGSDTNDNEVDFKQLKPSPRKTNNAF